MKIRELIDSIKAFCRGTDSKGNPINPVITRDQVLYGDINQECTGIVTTIYASPEVIRAAAKQGANLVICHETCFWCRGGKTEWLADNPVFRAKRALLDECGIAVWRCHDYIHSGIPVGPGGSYIDGIFYGLAQKLGWTSYSNGDFFRKCAITLGHFDTEEPGMEYMAEWLPSALGDEGDGLPISYVQAGGFSRYLCA